MSESASILSGVIRPSISSDVNGVAPGSGILPDSQMPGTLIQTRAAISVPLPTPAQSPVSFHTDDSSFAKSNSAAPSTTTPINLGGDLRENAREEGPRRPVTQTVPQDNPSTTQTPSMGGAVTASLATQASGQAVDASQVLGLVMESLAEGVCLCDLQGQIVWANSTFKQIDQVARNNIGAACQQAALSFLQQYETPNPLVSPRTRFDAGTEDQTKCYEASVSPVRDPATGRPTHVAAVVYDVTAARRVAQKMDAIDRAGTELVRLDADTIRKMNTAERLRVLEKKIIGFAHDLLHFDHFAIRLIDEKSGKLELVMSCGLPQEAMEVELFARSEGNGISGYVASTGRSYTCGDTAKDPRYVIGIAAARSSLTIPLRTSDKVIGVFNIESELPNNFSEQDRQFGEMFAMYIGMALHILDLLVVERSTTGKAVTGTVEGELSEPLDDITQVTTRLKQALAAAQNPGPSAGSISGPTPAGQSPSSPGTTVPLDPSITRFIERILADVDSIKRRMKDVAAGPATILGAEKCIAESALDPLLVGRRVLVADDDPRIRQIIRDVLRGRGAEVTICENGTQAMEAIDLLCRGKDPSAAAAGTSAGPGQERHLGTSASTGGPSKFDLIISDIKMPDRTGYDIFSMARRVMSGVPVILMTGFGYDPHHSIVRASQEGLSCVLFKPFQAERLIEEVHKALAKKA